MNEKQVFIVNRLKSFLVDHYAPEMIILYGSTARGDSDEFSDIDMMVIMDVEDDEKASAEMLAGTDHIVHDKHIFVRSVADFITQKDIPGTMVFSALSEGLVLYRYTDFDADATPLKSYKERKKDVIQGEYLDQAREFFGKGEMALDNMQIFRCRDYLRFAIVRALKAVMVFRDVHPTRSTDLEVLFEKARELCPEIGKLHQLIEELNKYCPAGNDPEEISKCRDMVGKTGFVADSVASFLDLKSL
ncbi:MAG: nucleotidyltransferase domain-containing protein [Desulfobacteraceae bacterium]|jgi:predicted nucleotidyltransferase